jgi:NAD(P)H-quinone oxidoreductase subunit 5
LSVFLLKKNGFWMIKPFMGGCSMSVLHISLFLQVMFFVSFVFSILSALCMLHPGIPQEFVRIHVGICAIPPIVAFINLVLNHGHKIWGLWHFGPLAWLTTLFVLTIGLIVQRYSMRYLLGDRHYRYYFTLLTLTASFAALAWLSNDLRSLLVCFAGTLLGLSLLIRLNREWQVARNAAALSLRMFAASWLMLFMAVFWLAHVTGHWQLSLALDKNALLLLSPWSRAMINLLLAAAVVIPAAQWPFQRWLLESVVAPTPVSAVMHAGVVNAGGILLTLFAPLFSGSLAQVFLVVLSGVSVVVGTGIIMVQVDYKRQLVGSTIAQMGFMLVQCALGAYLAAIIHAVLHGLFKSALFLQAGGAAGHNAEAAHVNASKRGSFLWSAAGYVSGVFVGAVFWLGSSGSAYHFISALMLGYSVSFAWKQLVVVGNTGVGRIAGFSLMAGAAIVFGVVPAIFYRLLHESIQQGTEPLSMVGILALFIFLTSIAIGAWLNHHRSSKLFALTYFWLVRLGEPRPESVESHPKYLSTGLSQGGHS